MLDLQKVAADVDALAGVLISRQPERQRRIDAAMDALEWLADATDALSLAADAPRMALPTGEAPTLAVPAPLLPAELFVVAVDGSQIEPDFHAEADWALINVGAAVLPYRLGEPARLFARPQIQPDLTDPAAPQPLATSDAVAARRLLAEAGLMTDLIREARGRPALAMMDGPLIAWRLDRILPAAAEKQHVESFLRVFEAAAEHRVPLAGYISRSRSHDLVNLLQRFLDTSVMDADLPDLRGLLDREIAERLLPEPGMRSAIFESNAAVLRTLYPAEHRRVGFFFLNAGGEIARVEVPEWVWSDSEVLRATHASLWQQVTLGRGYPLALSEAHEQAVVRAGDRAAFQELVRRTLARRGALVGPSAKARSKRGPIA